MKKHRRLLNIFLFLFIIMQNSMLILASDNYSDDWAKDDLYRDYIANYIKDKPISNILLKDESVSTNKIHFLPVLGDAILLESNGLFALIDGGEDSDNPKGLPSLEYPGYEDLIVDYIKKVASDQTGKVTLEFIIGTHAHSDHLGGLDTVVLNPDIDVKRAYLKEYNEERITDYEVQNWDNKEVYNQLIQALSQAEVEVIHDLTMDPFYLGEMKIELFNVERDEDFPIIKKGENENSLGIKVTANNHAVFLAGDMNNNDGDEERLSSLIGEVCLLKLGHHGLEGSSSKQFLNKLNPKYSIVSGYAKNLSKDTYSYLLDLGTRSYSTMSNNGVVIDFNVDDLGPSVYQEVLFGWQMINENKYYYTSNGELVRGWKSIDDSWYFFDEKNGKMITGWIQDKGNQYYLDIDGKLKTGWLQEDGKWYYLQSNGVMKTGWLQEGGKWYYLQSNGVMKTGWLQEGGKWYYLQSNGVMKTGWLQEDGKWYYLQSNGVMKTGWLQEDGKWYYLQSNGVMKTGWLQEGGKWYYLQSNGNMKTGWLQEGGKWYYLKPNGSMTVGWEQIDRKWYYFYTSGVMATSGVIDGWRTTSNGSAYKL